MPVDLNPTLDLHRRILSELEIRETATEEQETEARRALDNALQSIAAERRAIKQCRDLLTQAATLYKSFVGKDRVTTQSDVLQPTEAPVAVAAPELTPAPAVASDEPSPLATQALAPDANVPQPTESQFGGCGRARADTSTRRSRVTNHPPWPRKRLRPTPTCRNHPRYRPPPLNRHSSQQSRARNYRPQRWKSLRLA